MKYTEAVGKRLAELLKKANYNQKEISKESKISRVTINRTINGRASIITFGTLIVFCRTLNITLGDFLHLTYLMSMLNLVKRKREGVYLLRIG